MSRLLLIYDPAKNYTENFEHRLRTLGIDVCRAHNSVECLHALLHRAPDFLLLAPENDSLAFERLLKMLGPRGEALGVSRLFLTGTDSDRQLSDRWGWPLELCLGRPLDEARFFDLLGAEMEMGHESRSSVNTPRRERTI